MLYQPVIDTTTTPPNFETMNSKLFCDLYTNFYGEKIDNLNQIVVDTFKGVELFEFVKYCCGSNSKVESDILPQLESTQRKVLFTKWLPHTNENYKNLPGTGCWGKPFSNKGIFHHWGIGFEQTAEGIINFTIALVENEEGIIEEVMPTRLKFI